MERGVAQLGSAGALGALGRRFESCRPDHLNPSYTREFPRVAFLLENLTAAIAVKIPSKQFFIKTIFKKVEII